MASPIETVIALAEAEIGYLEKKNGNNLFDKTANAGSNNYTKYWVEVYPQFQGQPWCAAFVTWIFDKAFGKDMTKQLLGHYPYTYVPTLAAKFTKYANPQVGDIVMFYRNREFCHTGIVTYVKGDYFETIEGNTSGGSTIIANGGGVCKKKYYNSQLPGTKFMRPNYSLIPVVEEEEEEMTQEKFNEMMNVYLADLAKKEPDWEKEDMSWACAAGLVNGDGSTNGGGTQPKKFMTRGEVIAVIHRFGKYLADLTQKGM